MSVLSVANVSAQLGVSERRVRQMLADGSLAGERIGRAWVIHPDELSRHRQVDVGRPWKPASAWAVLSLADDHDIPLSAVEKSRARKRLALGLDKIAGRLAARCELRHVYGHPGVHDRLAKELVLGGASAAAHHESDLIVSGNIEGYIRASTYDPLVDRYALDDIADRPNVLLRIVQDDDWPFERDQRHAGRAIVAIDLLESNEPRSRRAGSEMLDS